MPDYSKGKIYAIRSPSTDSVYIGSTTMPLLLRMAQHKSTYRRSVTHTTVIEILKYKDAYIELVELCPCGSYNELLRREGEIIRQYPTHVNKVIAGRTSIERNAEMYIKKAIKKHGESYLYLARYDDDIYRIVVTCPYNHTFLLEGSKDRSKHLAGTDCRYCIRHQVRDKIAKHLTSLGIEYTCRDTGLRSAMIDIYLPKYDIIIIEDSISSDYVLSIPCNDMRSIRYIIKGFIRTRDPELYRQKYVDPAMTQRFSVITKEYETLPEDMRTMTLIEYGISKSTVGGGSDIDPSVGISDFESPITLLANTDPDPEPFWTHVLFR